jgi:uncharacterized protein YegP (UPF0339 family)
MATATKRSRRAARLARHPLDVDVPESMEFLVFEDNGGDHHWALVADNGAFLARSLAFASHDDAERAARHTRDGAASALFGRAAEARPVDLGARRAALSDDSEAERWLDEGAG